jgi:hypothetical protein
MKTFEYDPTLAEVIDTFGIDPAAMRALAPRLSRIGLGNPITFVPMLREGRVPRECVGKLVHVAATQGMIS